MEIKVMGVQIGTADEYDYVDDLLLQFYDFKPSIPTLHEATSITIDFEKGTLTYYAEDDDEYLEKDTVSLLDHLK